MTTPLREAMEEMLELCWTAAEDGLTPLDRDHLPTQLLCFLPHPIAPTDEPPQTTIDALLADGLLTAQQRRIELTHTGRTLARGVVRRHRLTEVLLRHVLDVSEESMESTACQVEHILNTEVTDAVCAFLGHPPSCPHGRAIPGGPCCAASARVIEPLIVPLARLPMGEHGTVAYVHTKRRGYAPRLSALGLIPGHTLQLVQTRPTVVVRIGETELALDAEAGTEIFVKRARSLSLAPEPALRAAA